MCVCVCVCVFVSVWVRVRVRVCGREGSRESTLNDSRGCPLVGWIEEEF